jgi:hypothetical protein
MSQFIKENRKYNFPFRAINEVFSALLFAIIGFGLRAARPVHRRWKICIVKLSTIPNSRDL